MGKILVIKRFFFIYNSKFQIFFLNFIFCVCKDIGLEKKIKLQNLAETLKGKHFVIATVQVCETFTFKLYCFLIEFCIRCTEQTVKLC